MVSTALVAAHPTFTPRVETTSCVNSDLVHDYVAVGSIQAGDRTIAAPGGGITSFQDGNLVLQCSGSSTAPGGGQQHGVSCTVAPGKPGDPGWGGVRCDAHAGDYDGDLEWGTSGGLFPATDSFGGQGIVSTTGAYNGLACDNGFPINHAHHGTSYTVADATGPGWFSIGSDDTTLGTTPTTDAFDDDSEGCDLADNSVTPDTDCDDYLTANHIGFAVAQQDAPFSGTNTLLDATSAAVHGLVSTVIGLLPPPLPATIATVTATVATVVDTVLNLVFGPGGVVCTPPAVGTPFPVSFDGTYVIFVTGAVINDNTRASVNPIIQPATVGHICGGAVGQTVCFGSA
jgi:hypothetical protein